MPPQTALLELATRTNTYVCRSCWTALGLSHPPQRFTRSYARHSRRGRGPSFSKAAVGLQTPRINVTSNESEAEARRRRQYEEPLDPDVPLAEQEPDKWTASDGSPIEKPEVHYFEKDPKTGEVTPIPDAEDDGEPEPSFDDLEELGRRIFSKANMLKTALGESNRLDSYLEKMLGKHGPPGAIEAFRAALKSYDEPNDDQPQSPLNIEDDSDSDIEEVVGSFIKDMSETNHDDAPELKETVGIFQGALKGLTDGARSKNTVKKATTRSSNDEARSDVLRIINSLDRDRLPPIVFSQDRYIHREWTFLNRRADILRNSLEASLKAIGKTENVRRELDFVTYQSFLDLTDAMNKPDTKVDKKFWQALWTIFSHEGQFNRNRMGRIVKLTKVMLDAGATLSNEQELLAIEATFMKGQTERALSWWKRQVTQLGHQDTRVAILYWELGVRMWCREGDLERAERACKILLEKSTPENPAGSRALLDLVELYCGNPETAEKAFTFYRRMRDFAANLGKPMEIKDYDDVISIFLRTGHTDYAMFAFTDMMFAGTIDLQGQAKFPGLLRNQFFFGKWLKRLIGEGELDGAYDVLVFMAKNGVMAASIQVNGLIGAWLRSGTVRNRDKAYSLAWAMIRSRHSFVDLRQREALVEWPMRLMERRPHTASDLEGRLKLDYGMVPKATVETFILLAGQYRQQGLFKRLEELFVAYKECEMPHDALMMNELIAAAVAEGHGEKAREIYTLMVHEHGVLPKIDTFAILFSSLLINMSRGPLPSQRLIAECTEQARAIFADMMRSAWMYQEKTPELGSKSLLSQQQAKLILHTFRKVGDWAGVSVALIGLRDVMRYQLTRGVMLEMIEGVERLEKPTQRSPKMVLRATLKLQKLVEDMHERGELDKHMTAEGVKDWRALYTILLSYYFNILQLSASDRPADLLIREAKREMGLPGGVD